MVASNLIGCILLVGLTIVLTVPATADDADLGNYIIHVCREGTANITWTPPAGDHSYTYVDVYYTRKPEEGKTYKQITLIWWTTSMGWQVVTNPSRFTGRLSATSASATTSFLLTNIIRIDNGKYELYAPANDGQVFLGTYDLIVYVEDNYYPDCISTDSNTTVPEDADTSTYVYTWKKSDDSPSIGIKMQPESDSATLKPNSCHFEGENTCDVVFTRDDFDVTGRVSFEVEYLFPDDFTQCSSLDEPPTNLMIDIPRAARLSSGMVAGIAIACLALIVIGSVVPILVKRHMHKNKTTLSQTECLRFVRKCIDYIQQPYVDNKNDSSDYAGLYRKNTQESVIKCYVADFKLKQGRDERLTEMFDDIPRKDLASCVKYILKIADEHWLAPEVQMKIALGERMYTTEAGDLKIEAVKSLFRSSGTNRMILADICRHFHMFLEMTKEFVAQGGSQIVNEAGLVTCVTPNFFKAVEPVDIKQSTEYTGREVEFIRNLIQHADQVFPQEAETTNTGDQSRIELMQV